MEPEPPEVANFFLESPLQPPKNTFTKQNLLPSPIVCGIFPTFKVSLLKPLHGLSSTFVNDENDQTLHAPEQDSYFGDDMSEDDDIAWNLGENPSKTDENVEKSPSPEEELVPVKVLVKLLSVCINGVEFLLNAGVRLCLVVPGTSGTEDSLLISIQSGFLLLVRIWRVPRDYGDASFNQTRDDGFPTNTLHFHKPFVVQWWKTSAENSAEISGAQISAHETGSAVVSALPASLFRIYMCENTDYGMQLLPHINVPVNGVILHSCFSRPLQDIGDTHLMFLVLTFSSARRLDLLLYNWYVSDQITDNMTKSVLPLNGQFPIPIMIIPLAQNHSFLLVCRDMFIVVTVHNITLADYSFSRFAYDQSFPTSYYIPKKEFTTSETKTDEVLLAAESGAIFSVVVTDNTKLTYTAVAQVADPISMFSFEKEEFGYRLIYGSDSGGSKELLLPQLLTDTQEKRYSHADLVENHKNWAPVVDIAVVDSIQLRHRAPYCSQELWALSGVGKRTKLSQLRLGYSIRKETKPVLSMRKTEALFLVEMYGRQFLVCAMPLSTKLLEISDSEGAESEPMVEVENEALVMDEPTLHVSVISGKYIVQFTPTKIVVTDLEKLAVAVLLQRILHVDVSGSIAAVVLDHEDGNIVEILKFEDLVDFDSFNLQTLASIGLNCQASTVRLHITDKVHLFIGSFDETLAVLEVENEKITEVATIDLPALNPYRKSDSLVYDHVVPHSIDILARGIFIGSSSGHLVHLDANLQPSQFLRLGYTPVSVVLCSNPNFLVVSCRNMWLFNFYESQSPSQLLFEEKTERVVLRLVEIPSVEDQKLKFVLSREDGLLLGSLFVHKVPILKQLSVGDTAKRLCYLDSINLFAVLCKSKDPLTRLRFADRKSHRMLATVEVDSKSGNQRTDTIFGAQELPQCGFVWHIQRQDRISKKLIVGTSINNTSGSVKILDVAKISIKGEETPVVKVSELAAFSRDAPISCIEQIGSTIFFASGCKIFSTSYSFDNKKLRPVRKLTELASDVISLAVDGTSLLVNTRLDLLLTFQYNEDEDTDMESETEGESEVLLVTYKDPVSRSLVNHCKLGEKLVAGDKLHSSLVWLDYVQKSVGALNYKMLVIPRVFVNEFRAFWSEKDLDRVLAVGVNGEVSLFGHVSDKCEEILELEDHLQKTRKVGLNWLVERLNRPFAEKVTGKGFQNVYKPYFDFAENSEKLIDYDLEGMCAHTSAMI